MITGTGCECTVMSDTRVPLLLCGALVILVLLRDVCACCGWRVCGGWGRRERHRGCGGGVFGGGVGERAVRADDAVSLR